MELGFHLHEWFVESKIPVSTCMGYSKIQCFCFKLCLFLSPTAMKKMLMATSIRLGRGVIVGGVGGRPR